MDTIFYGWIILFFVICAFEVATQQLVAIWFASASLICVFLSYLGVDFSIQLIVFIIVSIATLVILRPYAMKRLNTSTVSTNANEIIGKTAIVINDFDPLTKEGRVMIEGMDWAAKTNDDSELKKGNEVIVKQIEGVKVIVTREVN
ncbi:membrane protein implicated in regulation of membrane protease activity [Breznakia sp. PF5-3]|uniref:NfeD family protein n=1 Tax=unclassified Breznakia TaxID=2623764 RepID=UPI00240766D3|nr:MULTISPECIES: NfeD family protein [unclassified Breznakia]MDF9825578.1 membrane protein implicated in regulation of membrane protease activity [Breznakia sp. PM6-1]MDF9836431.1 membrane protein implicated in regulation of membrane protease activity [Breznakia sp. PF5-3]MDF9838561.1 membrane protein implicated in regulation of membrane protease activity [Breznakia sp. PFB2-8]MDF9860592.1 membrane protein implicated in regulation of membrane protease activity [Breznakia sp. PH5-24]